jgi:hypothetical protein
MVIESDYLNRLDKYEIDLQERWHEILSSEKYYLKYLEIVDSLINKKCLELNMNNLGLIFTCYLQDLICISKG